MNTIFEAFKECPGQPQDYFDRAIELSSIGNPEAITWYRLSANEGHIESQMALGRHYWTGDLVEEDQQEAFYWFMSASQAGHPDAHYMLGLCSSEGVASRPYMDASHRLFTRANQSDWTAEDPLSLMDDVSPEELLRSVTKSTSSGWGVPHL